jgi:hypothetical protein
MRESPKTVTPVVTGLDGLTHWLAEQRIRQVTLLVDAAVLDSAVTTATADVIADAGGHTRTVPVSGPADLFAVRRTAELVDGDLLVAIGGGTVIDHAKVANAVAGDCDLTSQAAAHGRCGALQLEGSGRGALLVAIPTTVGTGSERNRNAVITTDDRRLLLSGASLGVDLAVLDPSATVGLPREMLLEGIFEALCRTACPYVGSHAADSRSDQLAEAVAARLVVLGWKIAATPAGQEIDERTRHEVARLSGMSHTADMHAGRSPYAFKGWYVGHELSWLLGASKTGSLAVVLPKVWSQVLDGVTVWGDASRLRRLWSAITDALPRTLPTNPALGLCALLHGWRISAAAPQPAHLAALPRQILHRWGDGLPYLDGVTTDDLRLLLDAPVSSK